MLTYINKNQRKKTLYFIKLECDIYWVYEKVLSDIKYFLEIII